MDFDLSVYVWGLGSRDRRIDSHRSREKIKLVHLLAKHGAKWVPKDSRQINAARRSLLKLAPDYTIEFVWIMSKYQGCSREAVEQLLRTPTIKRHTSSHRGRLEELVSEWDQTRRGFS